MTRQQKGSAAADPFPLKRNKNGYIDVFLEPSKWIHLIFESLCLYSQ